jgi:hypothetical protein
MYYTKITYRMYDEKTSGDVESLDEGEEENEDEDYEDEDSGNRIEKKIESKERIEREN